MKKRKDSTSSGHIRSLLDIYAVKQDAIKQRLLEFANVPSREYFYELLYCLMTPQTSAEHADRVVQALRRLAFEREAIDPEPLLRDRRNYIRFHKTKSRNLVRIKQQFPEILDAIARSWSPGELRDWLVRNVKGLGYKEATHFQRNIGKNGGLAILDRHILRNLKRYGVLRSLPATLSRKRYFAIERRFAKFSEDIGIPLDELDLLFWSMETGEIRK